MDLREEIPTEDEYDLDLLLPDSLPEDLIDTKESPEMISDCITEKSDVGAENLDALSDIPSWWVLGWQAWSAIYCLKKQITQEAQQNTQKNNWEPTLKTCHMIFQEKI